MKAFQKYVVFRVLSIILNVILFLVHCQISGGSWTQGKVNATFDCLEVRPNKIIYFIYNWGTVYCSSYVFCIGALLKVGLQMSKFL